MHALHKQPEPRVGLVPGRIRLIADTRSELPEGPHLFLNGKFHALQFARTERQWILTATQLKPILRQALLFSIMPRASRGGVPCLRDFGRATPPPHPPPS